MKNYYAPIHIDFFNPEKDYSSKLLSGLKSSQDITILFWLLSQYHYRNISGNGYTEKLLLDGKFCKNSCFLSKLKQSNEKTVSAIQSLESNYFIDKVHTHDTGTMHVTVSNEFLRVSDKYQRFSICLNDILTFKYVEHTVLYILTRYGKPRSYLFHNYLCRILGLQHLDSNRQRAKIKRIFLLLVKKGYLRSFEYKKGSYKYSFER